MKMVTNNIFLVMLVVVSFVESILEPARNVIKLSHPLNKPNSTSYSRFIDAVNASQRRLSSMQVKTKNIMPANGTEIRVIPFATGLAFMANVSIGTPPIDQLLVMDTGSSFTWTQCKGCKPCKTQKGPMYDPETSLINIICGDPRCNWVPGYVCDESLCRYKMGYIDGSKSFGKVGLETFTFKTSKASGIVIGCGLHNEESLEHESSGILGLGTNEISISTSLGKKFSYCIGSLNNANPEYHFLIIGDGAIMAGSSSPLILENERYYVTLEGIMVGDVSLDIDPSVFTLNADKRGGVFIDSGTVLTYLIKPAYQKLRDEIVRLLHDLTIITSPSHPYLLCFHGWFKDTYVPSVILKFAKDQTISIEMECLFMQMNVDTFCMLVAQSNSMSMIGIFAQQYYNIGYDVPANNIYFYRTDCERTSLIV